MAKGKPAPEKSKLQRDRPLAYSKRSKTSSDSDKDEPEAATEEKAAAPAMNPEAKAEAEAPKPEAPKAEGEKAEVPDIEPPPPKGEPWPDATPQPMRPVEKPRVTAEMMSVPPPEEDAPAIPQRATATMAVAFGTNDTVEDPTFMPAPKDVPGGNPTDPALPPGRVPPGDSRSLRRGNEFALIYRVQTCVITRFGTVGERGQWRVVDYPTTSFASNSYAKECSRFVSDGFTDYRD